jgi:hypothetical protein
MENEPYNVALLRAKYHFFLKGVFSLQKQQYLRKESLKMIFSTIFVVRWKCVNLVKLGYIK